MRRSEGSTIRTCTSTSSSISSQRRCGPWPILVVGGRVFGYSDAPLERSGNTLTAVVPAALVLANPKVTVTHLFGAHRSIVPITGLHETNLTERLVELEKGPNESRFLLYGSRLSNLTVVQPATGVTLADLSAQDRGWLRVVTIHNDQRKSYKQIVLQRGTERPFLLAMPGAAKAPVVKALERVVVDSDVALFEADSNAGLKKVVWQEQDITTFKALDDGKTIRVWGLASRGISKAPTSQTFEFTFDGGKAAAGLEIVNKRVETVEK